MRFLTVIVPCLDEQVHLASLLPELARSGARVIVVDGGSSDESVALARSVRGIEVIESTPPRAAQMNEGAARAGSPALMFLHADAVPPPDFAAQVETTLADPEVAGGAFALGIDAPGVAAWVVSRGATLRSRITRTPYGDQGIFVRQSVFAALGGFAPWPFMEDLEFTHRLKRAGRIRLLPERVTVSARRWRAQGYARTTLHNTILAACFYLGIEPLRFARWVEPVREGAGRS
ncbi:MAG: TIGR04283 family arsenosugar biosynthesis glycosyltransferase [Acidobacteriota bacterium]